jgi:organic hydroperoxide reductase OsmC/OhrA
MVGRRGDPRYGSAVPVRAKELRFAVEVDEAGRMSTDGAPPLEPAAVWSPEHLLLAAVVRCSLSSLRHSARRAGAEASGSGRARGLVTRREGDGRYAFVEVVVELDAVVDPPPADAAALLAQAERGCFVGSSLTASPVYHWRLNGVDV